MDAERDVMEVIKRVTAGCEERAYIISQPKRAEDIHRSLGRPRRDIAFGDKHGDGGGDAIISPNLQNVRDQGGLVVQAAPLVAARVVWIVLEGKEGQI